MSFVAKRKCSISILLLASVWMLTITPVAAAEDDTFPPKQRRSTYSVDYRPKC